MRVVPRCAKLSGPPFVLSGLSGCNWALSDSRNSVVLASVQLPKTVPVDTGSVVREAVLNIDDYSITPLCS
jgi:hypothetical protein